MKLRGMDKAAALIAAFLAGSACLQGAAEAAVSCARTVTADVVALDQPIMFNRIGAQNVNGMIYALRNDVVLKRSVGGVPANTPLTDPAAAALTGPDLNGNVALRADKRPRPLVVRAAAGDCLQVVFQNLLAPVANPEPVVRVPAIGPPGTDPALTVPVDVDEQTKGRYAGFHPQGLQLLNGIADDASFVGKNVNSLVRPGESATYGFYAEREGTFLVSSYGSTFGSEGTQGNHANGLFGAVNVEPPGANFYRSQVTEEEMRLSTAATTPAGQPVLDYEARYPNAQPWIAEGKANLPILNMLDGTRLVHSDINAVIAGPNADGTFPPSTYPLESVGKRNPSLPNRLEPFREYTVIFHDEVAGAQAFPGFYVTDPVFRYVLAGVKDGFMINYGSGGIGSEIIANRLQVGPMHDCLDCAYEEFFLTSHTVGDVAMLVDVPANAGLEGLLPGAAPPPGTTGPKATKAFYPSDPSNVHHSYISDHVKFRNLHTGKEQHVFHLHNHQWLYSPNDENSNYLDAQGIGPGSGYTYEINFGGSGNRNKSAGDAIFHCHFYPHFAQGMWEMWRNHDVFESGTPLAVSQVGTTEVPGKGFFHSVPFSEQDGTPALDNPADPAGPRARALPDGEIVVGTPIPALVPLPGKALALMPGKTTVVSKVVNGVTVGSVAKVDRNDTDPALMTGINPTGLRNPGYPFWIAGIEDTVGQRPPTPPQDMNLAAGGWDGGLPRHALEGYASGGESLSTVSKTDFSKVITAAKAVFFPEDGTDVEKAAMQFHAGTRNHASYKVLPGGSVQAADFVTNGSGVPGQPGAPYHEPCLDDTGRRMDAGVVGTFFSGESLTGMSTRGSSVYNAENPRVYKGANIQFDAVFNKAGYHYPQQRIVALWNDVKPTIDKLRPPEPLVMRNNTFDCAMYHHTNLVPWFYQMDDYQVRTPTDIIGQHIHLPKWDLTTTDGSGNGWNYEDGTISPGTVRERIEAINHLGGLGLPNQAAGTGSPSAFALPGPMEPKEHPFFGQYPEGKCTPGAFGPWCGARTTLQRWFFDPVVNTAGQDRGLGIIFTHDHYGPSTHQQIGLYATVLAEPAGSVWRHNETGKLLGNNKGREYDNVARDADPSVDREDGGPTSWQAAIVPPAPAAMAALGSTVQSEAVEAFREFYFEFSDFQHAYEAGVYVGAGPDGKPIAGAKRINPDGTESPIPMTETFRYAINPPARLQINPVFPDLYWEIAGQGAVPGAFCPERPCPQAISVQDPGMHVTNYRNEPIGLRVFDPARLGPDGKPGMQADGLKGDLAFALQSRTDRAIAALNIQPDAPFGATSASITSQGTFPPRPTADMRPGDPYTHMMRTYAGDKVRVKMQAGGHEEEHNASIHGLKWLQAGSGHGSAPTSGWRNAQAAGISEQFTLNTAVNADITQLAPVADYAYSMDSSNDGWWSGMWGVLRDYRFARADLFQLPGNDPRQLLSVTNAKDFKYGVCPVTSKDVNYDITAVLANDVLPNALGVTIVPSTPDNAATMHAGGALKASGGTLVYNPRRTAIPAVTLIGDNGQPIVIGGHSGPIHDPTGMVYVRTADLTPAPVTAAEKLVCSVGGVNNPLCPVKLKATAPVEPIVLRAAAGNCVRVTLRNRLPGDRNRDGFLNDVPDLASYNSIQGVVKRDRGVEGTAQGSTTFNANLIRPSSYAGLHPQLVEYDVTLSDGTNVGLNNPLLPQTAPPGSLRLYTWYAGNLEKVPVTATSSRIVAKPVEFGGFNLTPADKIKQGQKGLVGAMTVEPAGATIAETDLAWDHQQGDPTKTRLSRTSATINKGTVAEFRDFSVVLQKDVSLRYADGTPVEHLNGEGVGIPEDPQDSSNMGMNYGVEPLWFRFGMAPNAPFGHATDALGNGVGLGDVEDGHKAYSNELAGGADPATPVFKATAGKEFRMHVGVPFGTSRGSTFNLHGHVWQRAPYLAEFTDPATGLPRDYALGGPGLGSVKIGHNPLSFYQGGQESITPYAHFDLRLPSAGGANAVKGDYLFRDQAGFGITSGMWGILRVQ